jgi:Protein of unknown function (DUF559)/Transcriptional regulator, AbiEi antitoxin
MHDSRAQLDTHGDPAVARVAAAQAAVVSVDQLHAAGLGRGAIAHRVRRGRLHRVHRGVYVVGVRRLTPRGRLWAAVLACGGPERGAISHRSALGVYELLDDLGPVDVTVVGESRSVPGIRVHRSQTLVFERDTLRQPDGLRVTTVARSLQDFSATASDRDLRRACHEADHRNLLDPDAIVAGPRLRAVLDRLAGTGPQLTRSELEERFLSLAERAGLPAPLVNHRLLGYTVDFFWPDARLVVETDGLRTHLRPATFEDDRERDARLHVAGYAVVRFTWRQLTERPDYVVATLVAAYRGGR